MTEAILELEDVSFSYENGGKKLDVLKNLNAGFEKGLLHVITGQSGSGKTTALSILGALDLPESGRVMFYGKDIRETGLTKHRRKNVALIFQNFNLINYMTAVENVVVAMDIAGSFKGEKKNQALKILEGLGITADEAARNVLKLSGGQQQRVAIARALATNAKVILADEPTGNLDVDTAKEIVALLYDLAHKYDKCVIAVSHSPEVAQRADAVYRFENGSLVRAS